MSPSTRSPIDPDRRLRRKVEGQLQNESMWLQKLLFAMGKVEDAREKLALTQQETLRPLVVLDDGTSVPIGLVARGVRQRVDEIMKSLGQGDQRLSR